MTEEEKRLMMADMLKRENNLLQYHQDSINNNLMFDDKGTPLPFPGCTIICNIPLNSYLSDQIISFQKNLNMKTKL